MSEFIDVHKLTFTFCLQSISFCLVEFCHLLGKVKVGEEVPAVLSPVKPKYYLLCSLSIPAGHCVQLKA